MTDNPRTRLVADHAADANPDAADLARRQPTRLWILEVTSPCVEGGAPTILFGEDKTRSSY